MKICAVLCVRNEGAFLLDWIAHHRACGVTDFVVLSNDCQDGTDALLDRLQLLGGLTHLRNDGPHGRNGIQFAGLKLADKSDRVKDADWLLPLDIDEFVNVHVGNRTLPALIETLSEATAITLTWRLFGNAGIERFEDRPIPEQFTRAAPEIMYWPWRSAMFKTLYRNDRTYRNLGVHRPRNPRDDRLADARWYDAHGRPLGEGFTTTRIFNNYGRPNYGLAQLNHYALGAMESYVLKAARGRAVHSDHMLGLDYWVERNFNTDEDATIQAMAKPAAAIRAELAEDAELAKLHEQAVHWRRAQFDSLLAQEPFRALMGRLLMTPPSQPVPLDQAQFLIRHATLARTRAAQAQQD